MPPPQCRSGGWPTYPRWSPGPSPRGEGDLNCKPGLATYPCWRGPRPTTPLLVPAQGSLGILAPSPTLSSHHHPAPTLYRTLHFFRASECPDSPPLLSPRPLLVLMAHSAITVWPPALDPERSSCSHSARDSGLQARGWPPIPPGGLLPSPTPRSGPKAPAARRRVPALTWAGRAGAGR